MNHVTPDERPASELVKEALEEARELIRLEVSLARNEVRNELGDAKGASILFGVAMVTAIVGLSLLLVAVALAIELSPTPALIIGLLCVAAASVCGTLGYKALPKKPMFRTRKRLEGEIKQLKERIA
jgi:uncharacterized membrane protein YqjE